MQRLTTVGLFKISKPMEQMEKGLKVKSKGNTFRIYGKPEHLEYWADDTFDARIRKNKVFEPAGTNNQERANFLLNAAGYFGFFEGQEGITP